MKQLSHFDFVTAALLTSCALSTACDSSQRQPPTISVEDAPPLNVVSVETFGELPLFIKYRTGDGPWQEPVDTGGAHRGERFELHVQDKYELIAVCGSQDTGYDVGIEASTYRETGGRTFLPCSGTSGPTGPVVASGTMAQPGTVTLAFASATSTAADWPFQLDVRAGLSDLIAVGDGHLLIRRDLNLAAPTISVPRIDVITDGLALLPVALQLRGVLPDDNVSTFYLLATENSFVQFEPEPGSTALVAPAQLLHRSDRQFVAVNSDSGRSKRLALTAYSGAVTPTLTLPPRLADIQFGPNRVSWSTLPPGDLELTIISAHTYVHSTPTQGCSTQRPS